jgi:hypothetical protein
LSSPTNVFTFQNLSQVYTDLLIVATIRTTRANTDPGADLQVTFNNDTGANYKVRGFEGNGNGAYGSSNFAVANGIGYILNVSSFATTNTFGTWQMSIPNYTSSNTKVCAMDSASETNGATSYMRVGTGFWNSTTAINRIDITDGNSSNFIAGSTVTIYGVNRIPTASLGATPAVDYLVVAGGGGSNQGGGGAGGLLTASGFSVAPGSPLTVTIGGGGAAGSGNGITLGGNGSSSVFSSITATGGGGGGAGNNNAGSGNNGGSGGGGAQVGGATSYGGTGIAGQGYAGGTNGGFGVANYPGGGGGGAGQVGGNAISATVPGNGGNGIVNTFSGNATYYAGGGGGGLNTGSGTNSIGGLGGGGNGAIANAAANPGTINTGGGAGATGNGGATGGSGLVAIRYPDTYTAPAAVTGNPMITFVNGYRVYTWTASGSITF